MVEISDRVLTNAGLKGDEEPVALVAMRTSKPRTTSRSICEEENSA